jgi:hypothetical protein
MLPRMKNKLVLTPELGPTFSARDEDLLLNLGILTRVLDGHGFESDSGTHGHRGYNEEMMFTQLGAAVDIPSRVYKHLSTLGPKLCFFRLPKTIQTENGYYDDSIGEDFKDKFQRIRIALHEYLAFFEMNPEIVEEIDLVKVPLNNQMDEEHAVRYIIRLARLLAPLRAVVPTWETHDTQGSDYTYRMAIIEDPSRAITQLKNLARGHALCLGRNYITVDDIPIVIQTTLSTASIERVTMFDLLIAYKGTLTTSQICESLNTTKPTALRTMTELKATGLVTMVEISPGEYNSQMKIVLNEEFKWFKTFKFEQLRRCKENSAYTQAPPLHNLIYDYTINKINVIKAKEVTCLKAYNSLHVDYVVDTTNLVEDRAGLSEYEGQIKSFKEKSDAIIISDKHSAYKSGGQWYCNNCNDRGDKFYMTEESHCRGNRR